MTLIEPGIMFRAPALSSSELAAHLQLLKIERWLVRAAPFRFDDHYLADLEDELRSTTIAYTTAKVLELARERPDGPCGRGQG